MNSIHYMEKSHSQNEAKDKRQAFSTFAVEAHPWATRFACMLLGSHAAAGPDIVQKAFVSAWNNLHTQSSSEKFPPWFRTIIINEVRSYFRWLGVRNRAKAFLKFVQRTEETPPLKDEGLRRRLEAALDELSLKQREVFVLVYINELSIPEAAEILNSAPGTVKSHLHRAVNKLRNTLKDLWSSP